jgi:hypothetical protein
MLHALLFLVILSAGFIAANPMKKDGSRSSSHPASAETSMAAIARQIALVRSRSQIDLHADTAPYAQQNIKQMAAWRASKYRSWVFIKVDMNNPSGKKN